MEDMEKFYCGCCGKLLLDPEKYFNSGYYPIAEDYYCEECIEDFFRGVEAEYDEE